MKNVTNGEMPQPKLKHGPTLVRPPAPTKLPETSRRRSFAETMMNSNHSFEPLLLPYIPALKLLQRAEPAKVLEPKLPVVRELLQSDKACAASGEDEGVS
ncbi:hypothetical protein SLA2020_273570 [Shorea laevis]